jgi:hypothetical protein
MLSLPIRPDLWLILSLLLLLLLVVVVVLSLWCSFFNISRTAVCEALPQNWSKSG